MFLQRTRENARKTDNRYVSVEAVYNFNVCKNTLHHVSLKTPTVGVEGVQKTRVHTDRNYCIYYVVGGTRNITLYQSCTQA
jgi:hypothetical protein